jgi:hypothetical protein
MHARSEQSNAPLQLDAREGLHCQQKDKVVLWSRLRDRCMVASLSFSFSCRRKIRIGRRWTSLECI